MTVANVYGILVFIFIFAFNLRIFRYNQVFNLFIYVFPLGITRISNWKRTEIRVAFFKINFKFISIGAKLILDVCVFFSHISENDFIFS